MEHKQLYDFKEKKLSYSLEKNYEFFKELFEKDDILRTRKLHVNQAVSFDCVLLFMDGMINSDTLNLSIVRPLLVTNKKNEQSSLTQYVLKEILFAAEASESDDIETMLRALLYGDTLLLLENTRKAILINTKGWRTRGITEPNNERILQGPREGFDEAVMLNLAMIRRKLPTPDLCVELQHIGRRTDTKIFICYLDSLVEKKILNELKKRLKQIDIDGVLDSNYINEFIRDGKFSLFKTIGTTERPDIVVARILEGRVAVFVDGTPVVMTLPYLFDENFQSDDDYYLNYFVASIGRILRYVCFFLSISVPGIYIALITAHNQLIPTSFAITIAASRGGVPFSSLSECIILIIIFEILKETGVRIPESVGHALSIVGGLVVGQAAVEAKIISAPMLIVVALSGISGLMIPRLKGMVFYARLCLVLLCSALGLYGYLIGITIILISAFSLESFGVDYTATLNKITFQSLKDTLVRSPWQTMRTRPESLSADHIRLRKKGE